MILDVMPAIEYVCLPGGDTMALDMSGRVCVVTGGSSGVGLAIARGCARNGATVALVSKDPRRGMEAVKALRSETHNSEIEWLGADLSDLDSVRDLATRVIERYGAIHVLSNNAATISLNRRVSRQGFELSFATNHLGHFLLTGLLLPALSKGAPSRAITVSGHPSTIRGARLDFSNLMLERNYSLLRATVNAAMARVLFTFELARRLEGRGITANTFHPGLVRSNLPSGLPWYLRLPGTLAMHALSRECPTGVFLASSPEVEATTGAIFVGRKPQSFPVPWDTREEARRLWDASEALVGQAV